MAPSAGVTHDITIEDTDASNKTGFMSWRGRNGRARHTVRDAGAGVPGEVARGPYYASVYEEDWVGGVGGRKHRLHPKMLASGTKIDSSVEGKIQNARELLATTLSSGSAASPQSSGLAIVETEVWMFQKNEFYRWNYTNKNWDSKVDFTANVAWFSRATEFNGSTYVTSATQVVRDNMWTPDKYAYKTGALGTWTIIPTSAAKDSWKFFAVADGKLWGGNEVTANNLIGSTASPTSAANFTTVAVGGTDAPITAMIGDGDTMLVCKTNGVWAYYPDGTLENLTPEFEARRHPHNFFNSYNWNGRILLPLGEGGLYQLHQGVITDISLKFYAPNETKLHGPISAISAEPSACYFLVRDATNSKQHVVKGEIVEIDGVSDWRFHHLAELAGIGSQVYNEVDGSTLLAEGVPSGTKVHHRLWVAAEQSTTNYPHFLPGVKRSALTVTTAA